MQNHQLLNPTLPTKTGLAITWANTNETSLALALANACEKQPLLVITKDNQQAIRLQYETSFFAGPELATDILVFPDWQLLPYDSFNAQGAIISERLQTLNRLPQLSRGIVFVPIATLMHRLSPKSHLDAHTFRLAKGETFDMAQTRERLVNAGYRSVGEVMEHGEFSVRGAIFDLYPMGSELPLRIDLFDDEIDSIRTFDPENQLSIEQIDKIELLPAQEFPLDQQGIEAFRKSWRNTFGGNPGECPVYQDVSDGIYSAGLEYYLPLFFQETSTLFDYLPADSLVIRCEGVEDACNDFWQEVSSRYEQKRHDITRPLLPPNDILQASQEVFAHCNDRAQVSIRSSIDKGGQSYNFQTIALPELAINRKQHNAFTALQSYLANYQGRVLFCADSPGRREVLLEMFASFKLQPTLCDSWQSFLDSNDKICITVAPLEDGLSTLAGNFCLISEPLLFGQSQAQPRKRSRFEPNADAIIKDLIELKIDAPIVHIEHGVGRYRGLQSLAINGQDTEFLTIEYADKNKVYVPVTSLHMISRYSGGDVDHAPLHRLGSEQWSKAKKKAAEKIRDVAAELLDVYARREAKPGFAFAAPNEDYFAFQASFPFEETPDQLQAIENTLADMQSDGPMDRLVCGDVGFGKTEVAMRAAFMATQSGKQVALLVPTTLLAQQHYESFRDRMAQWPIHIDVLSRFKTKKEQDETFAELERGKVDIIIGTHRLLSKDIKFKNLGLLIIDEEHRFGVQHKEKLKALRADIDILTLTATPIPRTLNMAFSGVRDLSIIATPPMRRLAVKTFVQESNDYTIREAILREILRGGQVYYVHNSVQTINKVAQELRELVPEVRVGIGHGQMRERELESVMHDFYRQRYNVLVATTIIESGIDVPTANTIIIDRADKFGLAQLHQMRGRVGRSSQQAYAYLLTPHERALTKDAKKRLEAISSLEELGAGFTLATHDMEIRGAGELLGEEQSGHMQAIGFTLYMELLDSAVKALKEGKEPNLLEPLQQTGEIDLQIPAMIPATYIPDVNTRLTLYKRIASVDEKDKLDTMHAEMVDRFGLMPEQVKNLFAITELKLHTIPLGIKKIEANSKGGRIEFNDNPNINPMTIIKMVQNRPNQYKLEGATKLRFIFASDNTKERLDLVKTIIDTLGKSE